MTTHRVFSCENSLTNRANCITPVYTTMMRQGITTIVYATADVAYPATTLIVKGFRPTPDPLGTKARLSLLVLRS